MRGLPEHPDTARARPGHPLAPRDHIAAELRTFPVEVPRVTGKRDYALPALRNEHLPERLGGVF